MLRLDTLFIMQPPPPPSQQRLITNPKKIKNKVLVNCTYCNKEFEVWKSRYIKAQNQFNGHLFCSRECSRSYQPKLYERFFWCGKCKWIRKETAIIKKKGTVNHYEYSKNVHLDKVNLSTQRPLSDNSILALTVNYDDIVTKSPIYNKYQLKRDRYYCPKCKSLIDCRKKGNKQVIFYHD